MVDFDFLIGLLVFARGWGCGYALIGMALALLKPFELCYGC